MYVKTFLIGLMLALKAARAYMQRNEDGIKEHLSADQYLLVLNALEAVTAVIDMLIGSPIIALGARVKRTNPEYQATLSNLREARSNDLVRISPRVMRRDELKEWLSTL